MKISSRSSEKIEGKVVLPIGAKLAFIIGLTVLISFAGLTHFTAKLMAESMKSSAMENNLSVNQRTASAVETYMEGLCSSVFSLLDLVNASGKGKYSAFGNLAEELYFERNPDIVSVNVYSGVDKSGKLITEKNLQNKNYLSVKEFKSAVFKNVEEDYAEDIEAVFLGNENSLCRNCSPYFDDYVLMLLIPWTEDEKLMCCSILFVSDAFEGLLEGSSGNSVFLSNCSGEYLYSPDGNVLKEKGKIQQKELLKALETSQTSGSNFQISYSVKNNRKTEKYIGSVMKIPSLDMAVVSSVSLSDALEDVYRTRKNNFILSAAVFFLTVIIILIYSRFGISQPLYRLVDASEEILKGNFNSSKIDSLNVKRHDEIGVLNESTKSEKQFLNTFAKFTNQNVAKAIAANTLDFNPHLKDLTVFFSDIRGFTAISDSFREKYGSNSAEEIIGFLNNYMSRMVDCVTLSHGNIDKFEGDAIMGLWGLLREEAMDSPDHEKHVKEDAVNAVTGALAMRYSLMEYNRDAASSGLPEIRIGCGLNTGRVTAGLLGSEDKMEYTAIGDAVNFASRTESSTKLCGTDILITEDTYNLLKQDFIRCKENNFTLKTENEAREIIVEKIPAAFEVKGKGKQHFYSVVNMPFLDIEAFFRQKDPNFKADEECLKACGKNGPATLRELRKLLGIKKPDFKKVNLNEEENKIQLSE